MFQDLLEVTLTNGFKGLRRNLLKIWPRRFNFENKAQNVYFQLILRSKILFVLFCVIFEPVLTKINGKIGHLEIFNKLLLL
jgi:hypothetical protein